MVDSNNEYRAKFNKSGAQKKWLSDLRESIHISELAKLCSCSERTIRDWQREKFLMDYTCLELLCKKFSLPMPEVKKIKKFAHTSAAGSKGGKATIERYGTLKIYEQNRRAAWKSWWERVGSKRQTSITKAKPILLPKPSEELAEFIGIILGDGTVAPYHINITLHALDDRGYSQHVAQTMEDLFGVKPKVYKRKNRQAIAVTLSRKEAVRFMVGQGIAVGDKIANASSVPKWIFTQKDYIVACVRGLVDTDGSVFDHKYRVKGREYVYKKISFSSASLHLRDDMARMLKSLEIKFCMSGTNVRLDSRQAVERYREVVGFNNPKHLKRIAK